VKSSLLISLFCHGAVLTVGAYLYRTGSPWSDPPRVVIEAKAEPAPPEALPECPPLAEPPRVEEVRPDVPEPEVIEVDPVPDEAWPVDESYRMRRLICLPSPLPRRATAAAAVPAPPVRPRVQPATNPRVRKPPAARRGGVSRGPVLVDRAKGPIEYPPAALRRGLTGRVVLCIDVGDDGVVVGVRVQRSSGHECLDGAAAAAAHRWRFKPALRNGRPAPGVYTRTVVFRLDT
jgi:protein TonB